MDYSQKYFRPYHKIVRKSQNQDYQYYKGYGKSNYQSPERAGHNQNYTQLRQRGKGSQAKSRRQQSKRQLNHSENHSHSPNRNTKTVETGQSYNMFKARGFSQPIWEHLYQEGLNAMKQRYEDAEQPKVKIDTECTFKPNIKKNKRYLIPSNSTFLERNQIWQDSKIQKIVKEKQEVVHRNLIDCTFKPQINEKSKSMKKTDQKGKHHQNQLSQGFKRQPSSQSQRSFRPQLAEIRIDQNGADQKRGKFNETLNKYTDKEKYQKGKTMEMAKVRNIIRNQLRKIQL